MGDLNQNFQVYKIFSMKGGLDGFVMLNGISKSMLAKWVCS